MVLLYVRVISIGTLMKGNSLKTKRHPRTSFDVSMQGRSICVNKSHFYTKDPVVQMKVMLQMQVQVLGVALFDLQKLDTDAQKSMNDIYLAVVKSSATSLTELRSNVKSQINTRVLAGIVLLHNQFDELHSQGQQITPYSLVDDINSQIKVRRDMLDELDSLNARDSIVLISERASSIELNQRQSTLCNRLVDKVVSLHLTCYLLLRHGFNQADLNARSTRSCIRWPSENDLNKHAVLILLITFRFLGEANAESLKIVFSKKDGYFKWPVTFPDIKGYAALDVLKADLSKLSLLASESCCFRFCRREPIGTQQEDLKLIAKLLGANRVNLSLAIERVLQWIVEPDVVFDNLKSDVLNPILRDADEGDILSGQKMSFDKATIFGRLSGLEKHFQRLQCQLTDSATVVSSTHESGL